MTAPAWHRNYDSGIPLTLEPYPERTLLDYLTAKFSDVYGLQ